MQIKPAIRLRINTLLLSWHPARSTNHQPANPDCEQEASKHLQPANDHLARFHAFGADQLRIMILGPQNRCRNPGCCDEPCHKASSESNQTSDEIQFEIPLRILDF